MPDPTDLDAALARCPDGDDLARRLAHMLIHGEGPRAAELRAAFPAIQLDRIDHAHARDCEGAPTGPDAAEEWVLPLASTIAPGRTVFLGGSHPQAITVGHPCHTCGRRVARILPAVIDLTEATPQGGAK